MFIAALFTIARTWKQPKCPMTEEWLKKMWYIYTMEYYLAMKRNEIVPFVGVFLMYLWEEVSSTSYYSPVLSGALPFNLISHL